MQIPGYKVDGAQDRPRLTVSRRSQYRLTRPDGGLCNLWNSWLESESAIGSLSGFCLPASDLRLMPSDFNSSAALPDPADSRHQPTATPRHVLISSAGKPRPTADRPHWCQPAWHHVVLITPTGMRVSCPVAGRVGRWHDDCTDFQTYLFRSLCRMGSHPQMAWNTRQPAPRQGPAIGSLLRLATSTRRAPPEKGAHLFLPASRRALGIRAAGANRGETAQALVTGQARAACPCPHLRCRSCRY